MIAPTETIESLLIYDDHLTPDDVRHFQEISRSLAITADISRADILICTQLSPTEALVVQHGQPNSILSLYDHEMTGHVLTQEQHPYLFRALRSGYIGRNQREFRSTGAPIMQDVWPVYCKSKLKRRQDRQTNPIIGAMVIESNMIAFERHRHRLVAFRRAVMWLQQMCLRGTIRNAENLSRFSLYDGIYLIDRERNLVYMSGIALNLFRSIGLASDIRGQLVSTLETADESIVEQAFQRDICIETRQESTDGRIWMRKAIPLVAPRLFGQHFHPQLLRMQEPPRLSSSSFWRRATKPEKEGVDAVLVLVHNATETIRKERELNVKSAIIQEVHHRVKNNLQTLSSILRMQARRSASEDARKQLNEAVHRVFSMSVIHEFLSQDDNRHINVSRVCQQIADQITQVASQPGQMIDVRVTGPKIHLPPGQATTLALVVNELLLNALEHGLQQQQRGRITIALHDGGHEAELVVEDNGTGLPEGFDPNQSQSLGLQIVRTLVTDDLKGRFTMESILDEGLPVGTRVMVTFAKVFAS
ncbi:MAG: histidine kinase N-terminal domain-containing protein [Chloroflexota bacterium]